MKNVMLTATEARSKAQNDLVIFNEVRDIELSILSASADGDYEIIIDSTAMTISAIYCNVWKGVVADRAKEIQMAQVTKYFTDLGYSIERRTNSSTGSTFVWVIYW